MRLLSERALTFERGDYKWPARRGGADSDRGNAIADVCSITKPTVREVMEEFTRIPLIDGKTFWELENELDRLG